MNKIAARKLVNSGLVNGNIKSMLARARENGAIVGQSTVNPNLPMDYFFRVCMTAFTGEDNTAPIKHDNHLIAINAIREFGDYLKVKEE